MGLRTWIYHKTGVNLKNKPIQKTFHKSKTLSRSIKKMADGSYEITLNKQPFLVPEHWFWPEFIDGWEESTWEFYNSYMKKGGTAIDIGSWIGPTLLFASVAGATKFLAIEANPETYKLVNELKNNNEYFSSLIIENAAISNKEGQISFGNLDQSKATSSASSTRGTGFLVNAETIQNVLAKHKIDDISVIKIDIEGSELEIVDQIIELKKYNAPILLSLHPPFWSQGIENIFKIADHFEMFTPDNKPLSLDMLKSMVAYSEKEPPAWGTKFGNFFEIILKTK